MTVAEAVPAGVTVVLDADAVMFSSLQIWDVNPMRAVLQVSILFWSMMDQEEEG